MSMVPGQWRAARPFISVLLIGVVAATGASAQDWNPFKNDGPIPVQPRQSRQAEPPADMGTEPAYTPSGQGTFVDDAPPTNPGGARAGPVVIEQGGLPPIAPAPGGVDAVAPTTPLNRADSGNGFASAAWQGLEPQQLGEMLAGLELPPKSPALARLFADVLGARGAPLRGAPASGVGTMAAVRAEGLQRAGRLKQALLLVEDADAGQSPLAAAVRAKLDIAVGDPERGCRTAQQLIASSPEILKGLRGDLIVITGYCAARSGNGAAAGIAAGAARDEGHTGWAADALEAIAAGDKPTLNGAHRIGPLEYRLYAAGKGDDMVALLERLEPASLALLAQEGGIDPRLKVAAAEAAARLNVIEPEQLTAVWREQSFPAQDLALGQPEHVSPLLRRAFLFKVAESERNPAKRTRAIRALLDDTRRTGLYFASLRAVGTATAQVQPVAEVGWFAETGIEVALAAADYDNARRWAQVGSGPDRPAAQHLDYWLALIDIADPALRGGRGQSLVSVEALALSGRFSSDLLHRLATVLDALDYNVPIPLWNAASRTPQPTSGYLPPTGVLAELAAASKSHEEMKTIALVLKAMGPGASDSLNILTLGDVMRALKRIGFEAEARQVGLEALLAAWPRVSGL